MRTRDVLKELRNGIWFDALQEQDLRALCPASKKNLFDTVSKYARKEMVLRGQIFPVGESELGWWRMTEAGSARAQGEGLSWAPKYTTHSALLEIESEDIPRAGGSLARKSEQE